jgi:hypothetical protein
LTPGSKLYLQHTLALSVGAAICSLASVGVSVTSAGQHGDDVHRFALSVLPRWSQHLVLPVILSIPLITAPVPARAAAATEADMNFYGRLASLNVCIARREGVEFKKAVSIAAEMIAQVLKGKHGSMIQSLGSKVMTLKQLRNGSVNSAVIGAVQMCPKEVPSDVVASVKKLLQRTPPGGRTAP